MDHTRPLLLDRGSRPDQNHLSVVDASVELEQPSVIVEPRLVPASGHRVEDVQTRASSSLRRLPVLLQPAPVENGDDPVAPGGLAARVGDIPFAEPEVELTVGGRRAGGRLGRRGRLLLRVQRPKAGTSGEQSCQRNNPDAPSQSHRPRIVESQELPWIRNHLLPSRVSTSSGLSTSPSIGGKERAHFTLRVRRSDFSASCGRSPRNSPGLFSGAWSSPTVSPGSATSSSRKTGRR